MIHNPDMTQHFTSPPWYIRVTYHAEDTKKESPVIVFFNVATLESAKNELEIVLRDKSESGSRLVQPAIMP